MFDGKDNTNAARDLNEVYFLESVGLLKSQSGAWIERQVHG
jgi:hypothetical protein